MIDPVSLRTRAARSRRASARARLTRLAAALSTILLAAGASSGQGEPSLTSEGFDRDVIPIGEETRAIVTLRASCIVTLPGQGTSATFGLRSMPRWYDVNLSPTELRARTEDCVDGMWTGSTVITARPLIAARAFDETPIEVRARVGDTIYYGGEIDVPAVAGFVGRTEARGEDGVAANDELFGDKPFFWPRIRLASYSNAPVNVTFSLEEGTAGWRFELPPPLVVTSTRIAPLWRLGDGSGTLDVPIEAIREAAGGDGSARIRIDVAASERTGYHGESIEVTLSVTIHHGTPLGVASVIVAGVLASAIWGRRS